ncbi:MAG: archaemetzincin family Zn-dependent metalloprotease [Acidobacteriota bacterium]
MKEIRLIGVGPVESDALGFLELALSDALDVPCRTDASRLDADFAYDSSRGQFYSTEILARLATLSGSFPGAKVLGVTAVDLFIPILTFVFGEAQVGGSAALLSTHRLRQSFYGLPEDSRVFLNRLEKEALHELGHTFGLLHCRTVDCVMHFSNSVDEVDLKSRYFCAECRRLGHPFVPDREPPAWNGR